MRSSLQISEAMARKMKTVAHHYDHADRVRKNAIAIGKSENLSQRDLLLLETAALWHDIGRDYVENQKFHSDKSAEMFSNTFKNTKYFTDQEKQYIEFIIKYHDKFHHAKKICKDNKLLKMLRILMDADALELIGKIGYLRAVETANFIKDVTLIDQLNKQIRWAKIISTKHAKKRARLGLKYIKNLYALLNCFPVIQING